MTNIDKDIYYNLLSAFIEYKYTYISIFKNQLIQNFKRDKKYNRDKALIKLKNYIKSFENCFFFVEFYNLYPTEAVRWLNDIEEECLKNTKRICLIYDKKTKT